MLRLDGVGKRFDGGLHALAGLNLAIEAGEIVSFVGASGCGKSTLLRLVSGLESPSEGRVVLNGAPVSGPQSQIGFVFQEPRLMPWLDVAENVRFGLHALPPAEQRERVAEALDKVGLSAFAKALPRELSGGMAQRVAIARALARRPSVLALDEPFSALDYFTRLALQDHLLELWAAARFTVLLVTHDVEEAAHLSDRVLVLAGRPGRIVREIAIDEPRPRRRASPALERAKEEILDAIGAR